MGAQRLLTSLFILSVVSLVVNADATKCHDTVIQNLGVSQEEAKSLCAACMSVLPCNQCTSCFQAAKTLLAAAQCPINAMGTDSAHVMRRQANVVDSQDSPADQSPDSEPSPVDQSPVDESPVPEDASPPADDSEAPIKGGGHGVVQPESITILIG